MDHPHYQMAVYKVWKMEIVAPSAWNYPAVILTLKTTRNGLTNRETGKRKGRNEVEKIVAREVRLHDVAGQTDTVGK